MGSALTSRAAAGGLSVSTHVSCVPLQQLRSWIGHGGRLWRSSARRALTCARFLLLLLRSAGLQKALDGDGASGPAGGATIEVKAGAQKSGENENGARVCHSR